jgi:hypothetical protein
LGIKKGELMPIYAVHIRAKYEAIVHVEADSIEEVDDKVDWEEVQADMAKAEGQWDIISKWRDG